MKPLFTGLMLILFSLSLFTACKKDDDDNEASTNKMSVTIDGTKWESTGYEINLSTNGSLSTIIATGANNTQIYLAFQGSAGSTDLVAAVYTEDANACSANPTSAQLTITRMGTGNDVAGTFSFNGICATGGSKSLTSGSFDFGN
ncbi:MAG: hypothetical protein R2798_06785 [Chitinophagales bacterium]|nr:hypothetical protein [Bacteroidota bacterium]